MIEAEAQLRRGLLLISDLPDWRNTEAGQELDLQVTLASALMESNGNVRPEVSEVLGGARRLIVETEATGTILHFSVLYGLWVTHYFGRKSSASVEQAEGFLSLAELETQSGILLVGHRLVGSSLVFAGRNYPAALCHLDRAVALYRPEEHRELAFRFGADIGITAQCARGLALWRCGYPDQARRGRGGARSRPTIRPSSHARLRTDLQGPDLDLGALGGGDGEAANELVSHTREHGFALFLGYGLLLQAGALILRGQGEAAVERIHRAMAVMQATGIHHSEPMVLGFLAKALALTGAVAEGLSAIATAFARSEILEHIGPTRSSTACAVTS